MDDAAAIAWPVKMREMQTHHIDSTRWNGFQFRAGDIVIATYAKSGTTWVQQIVSQLIFDGAEGVDVHQLSPWVDNRLTPAEAIDRLARQTHRRFMKTHLPVDALVFSPLAKYIYIGRDGRDAAWSFHNHHYNATDKYFEVYNAQRPAGTWVLERGPADPLDFYRAWLAGNGFPMWPFWENVRAWWGVRDLPNVLLMHFGVLTADLEGSVRRIADFLAIPVAPEVLPRIVEHCSFAYMKANATTVAPPMWKDGAQTFINKGTNGRWRDRLSAAEAAAYEARALAELGPECARWLATGEGAG